MKRRLLVYVWDVEAVEWDRPVCAVIVCEDGGVWRFVGDDCLERVAAFMASHPGVYHAHYGGGYDVPLLMNVRGFSEIVLSGTNILIAREGRSLVLRDTFPLWLSSLKRVGEAVGHAKWEDRSDRIEELSLSEIVDHCENDCRVVLAGLLATWAFMDAHGAKHASTSGSSAVGLVRALEDASWRVLTRNRCDVSDVMRALDDGAGRGALTNCYARGVVQNVTSLDFKSAYPACYAFDEVPVGMRESSPDERVEGSVVLGRWEWKRRDLPPPAVDFASGSMFGPCEAWLTDDEIALFGEHGVKVDRVKAWAPLEWFPVGQTFAKVMFNAKEGASAARFFSKVFLNAWIGKTLEHPAKEHFTAWTPAEHCKAFGEPVLVGDPKREGHRWWRYHTLEHADDGKVNPHQQPILGENVLGRQRARLMRAVHRLRAAGHGVFYHDTDSIHTDCPLRELPSVLGDVMGTTLGKLAVEATGCVGYYLGPKAYLLVDDNAEPANVKDKAKGTFFARGEVVKQALKGIPLRSYQKGTLDDGLFREATRSEVRNGVARDVRIELFERALGGGADCMKDGIATFLRGVNGYETVLGKHGPAEWGRAPSVRRVRPSGRGKTFRADEGPSACYGVSIVEACAVAALLKLRERPMSLARWIKVPETARKWLRGMQYVDAMKPRVPLASKKSVLDELLETNGVHHRDRANEDGAFGFVRGSLLDVFRQETSGMTHWNELEPLLPWLAEQVGRDRLVLPARVYDAETHFQATDDGLEWLASMGSIAAGETSPAGRKPGRDDAPEER